MCTLCGLPTTHSNLPAALAAGALVSGALTTYVGAKIIITSTRVRSWRKRKELPTQS